VVRTTLADRCAHISAHHAEVVAHRDQQQSGLFNSVHHQGLHIGSSRQPLQTLLQGNEIKPWTQIRSVCQSRG